MERLLVSSPAAVPRRCRSCGAVRAATAGAASAGGDPRVWARGWSRPGKVATQVWGKLTSGGGAGEPGLPEEATPAPAAASSPPEPVVSSGPSFWGVTFSWGNNGGKAAEAAEPAEPAAPPPPPPPPLPPPPPRARLPVYVMLPLDVVTRDGSLTNAAALPGAFKALKSAGVEGVMVDMWWGVVERVGPGQYDWDAYRQLAELLKAAGLRMQACFSFHACGANVGDVVEIPLPSWVLECALQDPDMLFTDQHGYRNPECLSLFADDAASLAGRTPLQCYADFCRSFAKEFEQELGSLITEVFVGCGPCGELRYPAYPENKRSPSASQWRFPGIGEFQCYDRRALASMAAAAAAASRPEWGEAGPHNAGGYNDLPQQTGFFDASGSWDSAYGQFFLGWYSGQLVAHGERVLNAALEALAGRGVRLGLKCAGVHWWYGHASHAAELTAGYFNTRAGARFPARNGYEPIIQLCARLDVSLNFTCVEMRDSEHPWQAMCGPEGLLRQIRETAARHSVPVVGENALCRTDGEAYERMFVNMLGDARLEPSTGRLATPPWGMPPMASFTFLRLSPGLINGDQYRNFSRFVRRLREASGDAQIEAAAEAAAAEAAAGAATAEAAAAATAASAAEAAAPAVAEVAAEPAPAPAQPLELAIVPAAAELQMLANDAARRYANERTL